MLIFNTIKCTYRIGVGIMAIAHRHYTIEFQSDRLTWMQNKCIFYNYPNNFRKK